MKKKIAVGIGAGLLLFGSIAYAGGTYKKIEVFFDRINIAINGQQSQLSKDSIFYNGSIYVPLRSMGEMLGAEVSWSDADRTVHLDFLKDLKGDMYQASTQGLYQYMAIENNRMMKDMVTAFQTDHISSMHNVISGYDHLIELSGQLGDKDIQTSLEKMKAALELLRGGWEVKDVDDYALAWTIYYTNADKLIQLLKPKISGQTQFNFQVNDINQ
jgi:hypothetical protein